MTDRDLIARLRGYISKASFATEADRYTVTTLLDEVAAALAREQEAQPFPEDAVTFLREHGYEWSADILARERNKVTKEEMGRVVLEASTGMHGDIAKALALELCAVLAPTVGYLASDGYFIASQDYVRVHGQVPRGSPLFLRAAQPAAQEPVSLIERFDWHMRGVAAVFPKETQVVVLEHACAVLAAALAREQEAQPAYPEGEVVGPCVCGSWPGGKCLKCRWIPAAQPAAQEPKP